MDSILSLTGLLEALQPSTLVLILLATTFGAIIGALPGFSSVMAISLLLPVVLPMDPAVGLILLGSIYMGAMYGDANSAILLNIPGTASSLPTTFDGYPMTQQGRAYEALLAALFGSVFGGIVGIVVLMLAFTALARISLLFGPQEYFWITVLGLTTIASLKSETLVKGLLGGAIGLAISMIGLDPYWGTPRFTFGSSHLIAGVNLIPALLGLFCLAQILEAASGGERTKPAHQFQRKTSDLKLVLRKMLQRWDVMIRSSAIGILIGILPGAGGPIASTISYNETRRWDKNPEKYGKGAVEGVLASEVANNSMVGGSLIPMMALGIPGNVNAAVILGALLSFGLQPGTALLNDSSGTAFTFMFGLLISSIVLAPLGYFIIVRLGTQILRVPAAILTPSILVFATIGAYSVTNSMISVVIMIVMGIGGYFLRRVGIEAAPIALGLILGPIAEREFTASILIAQAQGSYLTLVMRPISAVIVALCLLSIISPLIAARRQRKNKATAGESTDA